MTKGSRSFIFSYAARWRSSGRQPLPTAAGHWWNGLRWPTA